MEKYKHLYWELQCELDRIDMLRKNWSYFTLKRAAALEKVRLDFEISPPSPNVMDFNDDAARDDGFDEVDSFVL